MERNSLPKKWILGINNGLNLLRELEKEIEKTSLECCLDRANTNREAKELIVCWTYDLVVFDPIMTFGLKLMGTAMLRNLPVAILSDSPTSLEVWNGFRRSRNGKKPQVYFLEGGFGGPSFSLEHLLTKPLSPWWSRLYENMRFNFSTVAQGDDLDPIQEEFIQKGAIQCGFCTPGRIQAIKARIKRPGGWQTEQKRLLIDHEVWGLKKGGNIRKRFTP